MSSNNLVFKRMAEGIGMKNLNYLFWDLKEKLRFFDFDLCTSDLNLADDADLVICLDAPDLLPTVKKAFQVWCLIIYDPPVYVPKSWDKIFHDIFDVIFTFDQTLVDNKKYFYYPFSIDTEYFDLPIVSNKEEFRDKKLACIVSNAIHKGVNKKFPSTTHHLRYDVIKWYGYYHPEDFDFYSGSFELRNYFWSFKGARYLKKIVGPLVFKSLASFFQRKLIRVFGGSLTALGKFTVIRNYRFYYCYENTIGINGYLTEKLFDCLFCGVVPIYWGAPNVKELIPYNCYINGEEFNSEKELYEFLKNMSYNEYKNYQLEAIKFLTSPKLEKFMVKSSTKSFLAPLMKYFPNIGFIE